MEGDKLDTFYLTFIGEFVQLVGQFSIRDETAVTTIQGYILDIDDNFYYIGETPEEITIALKKEIVYSIEIVGKPDFYKDLLRDMGVPDDKDKHN